MLFIFRPFGRPTVYAFWGIYIFNQGLDGSVTGYEAMALGVAVFIAAIIQIFHTCVSLQFICYLNYIHTHIFLCIKII